MRAVLLDELHTSVLAAAGTVGYSFQVAAAQAAAWQGLHDAQALHAFLQYGTAARDLRKWRQDVHYSPLVSFATLAGGSEADGFAALTDDANAAIRAWMLESPCDALARAPTYAWTTGALSTGECRTMDGGVAAGGLHAATRRYMDVAARVLQTVERSSVPPAHANGSGWQLQPPLEWSALGLPFNATVVAALNGTTVAPFSIPAVLSGGDAALLLHYNARVLQPLMQQLTQLHRDASTERVRWLRAFLVGFLAVGVAAIGAAIQFVFLPILWDMDRTVRMKRGLLLLVPPEALALVPSIAAAASRAVGGVGARSSKRASVAPAPRATDGIQ
jgi:hypothetical protein